MSKTTAVHPGPLYNIHNFVISSYQEISSSRIFKETLRECAAFNKLLTAPQDFQELHIRNLEKVGVAPPTSLN
jgi:hypothetical protein